MNNNPEKTSKQKQKEQLPTAYQRFYEKQFGKPVEEIVGVNEGEKIAYSLVQFSGYRTNLVAQAPP